MITVMYAIAFDLDTTKMCEIFGETNYRNKYKEVRDFLAERGFTNQQGSLYYGDDTVTPNGPALAMFDMSKQFLWLKDCVSDIRVLRLMDSDDLMPFVLRGNPN